MRNIQNYYLKTNFLNANGQPIYLNTNGLTFTKGNYGRVYAMPIPVYKGTQSVKTGRGDIHTNLLTRNGSRIYINKKGDVKVRKLNGTISRFSIPTGKKTGHINWLFEKSYGPNNSNNNQGAMKNLKKQKEGNLNVSIRKNKKEVGIQTNASIQVVKDKTVMYFLGSLGRDGRFDYEKSVLKKLYKNIYESYLIKTNKYRVMGICNINSNNAPKRYLGTMKNKLVTVAISYYKMNPHKKKVFRDCFKSKIIGPCLENLIEALMHCN
jgi:hypothetical protein